MKGILPEGPRSCFAPPPETSKRVEQIIALMRLGRNQVRASFGGVMGFDWTSIEMLAQKAGVATDIDFWDVFGMGEGEWVGIMNKPTEK